VAQLIASTAADIPAVMFEQADAEKRHRLFEAWTTSLGLPLREAPRGLSITRWVDATGTALLLLESDEPIPFSSDVNLTLSRRKRVIQPFPPLEPPTRRRPAVMFSPIGTVTWVPVPTLVLTDREETRALIIPDGGALAGGTYRLELNIDRPRWRSAAPDSTSNYRATTTVPLSWT
jgi:hypothetical protein